MEHELIYGIGGYGFVETSMDTLRGASKEQIPSYGVEEYSKAINEEGRLLCGIQDDVKKEIALFYKEDEATFSPGALCRHPVKRTIASQIKDAGMTFQEGYNIVVVKVTKIGSYHLPNRNQTIVNTK